MPQTTDHRLVLIGRWTTIAATVLATVLSPIFGHYDTSFKGLNTLICYIALKDFMLASFGIFCVCVAIQVIASLALAEPLRPEARALVWEHWTEPLRVKCGSGLSDESP